MGRSLGRRLCYVEGGGTEAPLACYLQCPRANLNCDVSPAGTAKRPAAAKRTGPPFAFEDSDSRPPIARGQDCSPGRRLCYGHLPEWGEGEMAPTGYASNGFGIFFP